MLVDKQSQLMSDLLFTVHQHGGDDVTWKPPIRPNWFLFSNNKKVQWSLYITNRGVTNDVP